MKAKSRIPSLCFSLLASLAACANVVHASVAYIVNCCNHPSTVSVVHASTGEQTKQWTVGTGAFATVFSPDGGTAYISNEVSESVTVMEVASGYTLATIPVGYQIEWIAITPDGRKLFAESYDYAYESHIVSIDTVTNTVIQTAGFAAYLGPMVVSPDGRRLYVNSSFSAEPGLLAIDTDFLTVKATVPMGASNGVAITPDGRFVYVPNLGTGQPYSPSVAIVDTSTNKVTGSIPLATNLNPGFVQVSPDGSTVWVSEFPLYNNVSPAVIVISTATNKIAGQVTLLKKATPGAIVFSPDGARAWVVAGGSAVDEVDVMHQQAVSEIAALGSVNGPSVSPNGRILLLPNTGDSQVAAIGQSGGKRLADVSVGAMDWSTSQLFSQYGGAAVSSDGERAYVTNYASSNLSIVDTTSKEVIASVETGSSPVGVAVSPDGADAYVANSFSNSVTVIDTKTFATRRIALPHHTYPSSIAISPDGARVYVAGNNPIPDFGTARCYVFVIDTSSDEVMDSIRVPYPMALTVSPDGSKVYVASGGSSLYTISTADDTVMNTLFLANTGPQQPITGGVAVTPNGKRVFMDDGSDNRIFEVDTTQNKVVAKIQAGLLPGVLAVTPDGSQLWAGDYHATSASVIDIASGKIVRSIPLGSQSYGIAFGPQ
jgi:YVTN family beta-propeller protein